MKESSVDKYEAIVELSRKRGIFWTSFEIYGGVAGFYDFGPVGVLIKREIARHWLKYFVYSRENVVEIETPMINPRIVFKASGHEDHFTDPVLACSKCGRVYRADHLVKEQLGLNIEGWRVEDITRLVREHGLKCPDCGGDFEPAFNALLLFATHIGPYKGEVGYLRPEHAQGMFINFPQVFRIARNTLPLGIAQIGRVARNEISPRQGLLRLREFTIMEVEFFFDPEESGRVVVETIQREGLADEKLNIITAEKRNAGLEEIEVYTTLDLIEKDIVKTPWLAYWMAIGNRFVKSMGVPPDKIRFIEKLPVERAHYSAQTFDQEVYTERFGWIEVAGYAYRTDYDIKRHAEESNADFTVFKRFEEPRIVKIKKAIPNPECISRIVGREELGKIMAKLGARSPDHIIAELDRNHYLDIDGVRISEECFYIKEEELKIHGKKIYPHVVEPSFGLERLLYVLLEYALTEREGKTVLRVPYSLAPYHVAVFPLLAGKKPEHQQMIETARSIYKMLVNSGFRVYYDEEGSIGRRYARADEIGIPFAITVDHQTLVDRTVTIRDRDTTQQVRVRIDDITSYLVKELTPGAIL